MVIFSTNKKNTEKKIGKYCLHEDDVGKCLRRRICFLKKCLQKKICHTPPPPLQKNNGPSLKDAGTMINVFVSLKFTRKKIALRKSLTACYRTKPITRKTNCTELWDVAKNDKVTSTAHARVGNL